MVEAVGVLLMIVSTAIITYQDFSMRYIHIASIVILLAGILLYRAKNIAISAEYLIINIIYLSMLLLLLYGYFTLKYGKKKFINRYIGSGDVILFAIFCIFYGLFYYIIFLICSCFIALCIGIYLRRGKTITRIPLAGCMAITHAILLIIAFVFHIEMIGLQF